MYLITNRNLCSKEKYLNTIVEAAKDKVDYLILREKDLDYPDLKDLYLCCQHVLPAVAPHLRHRIP